MARGADWRRRVLGPPRRPRRPAVAIKRGTGGRQPSCFTEGDASHSRSQPVAEEGGCGAGGGLPGCPPGARLTRRRRPPPPP